MAFLSELSIITFNVRRSVIPHTDAEAAADKFKLILDQLRAGADFICLQEVGVFDDADVAVLSKRLEPLGANVRFAGAQDGDDRGNTGVAVVIASGWDVRAVKRHPSGRALAVCVRRGRCVVTVASVYMPSGLDNSGRHHENSRVAQSIYLFLQEQVYAADQSFLIGGDLNETRGPLDRLFTRNHGPIKANALKPAAYAARLINEFLGEEDVVTDVVRHVNPGKQVPTRIGPIAGGKSYSRIDYVLVPTATCVDGVGTWTTEILEKGVASDHFPVRATFVPDGGSGSAAGNGGHNRAWSPDVLSVTRTPKTMQDAIVRDSEAKAETIIRLWPKPRGDRRKRVRELNNQTRRCLDVFGGVLERRTRKLRRRNKQRGMDMFEQMDDIQLRGFLESRKHEVGPELGREDLLAEIRKHGLHWEQPMDPERPLSALERDRALLNVAETLRDSLDRIAIPLGLEMVDGKAHRRAVGRLQTLTGKYQGVRHNDVEGLRALADGILRDKRIRRRMLEEWQARPSVTRQHSRLLQALHGDPRRLGEFIKRFLRGGSNARCTLDRATCEDGTIVYDPEVYKPIVKAEVAAPLSNRVEMPPAFDGVRARPRLAEPFASTDARARGCRPFWFDELYRPRQESRRRFSGLMAAPTAAEIFRVIRRANAGKSPGHDLLDIDFWKLVTAAGPGESRCLDVVVLLIGASLELGEVPDVLKLGWITMVPKVKPDGSFQCKASAMRPITVLSELGKIASRLLAARINSVLVRHPCLLSEAQRGFINDGSIDQCSDVVLDVIEDWRQRVEGPRRRGESREALYVVSYDQAKAYDSVQGYSIRASLERLGMPDQLVSYVMSSLSGATSRVRTAGGLTDEFPLMSGVRQGDPLSPLIYIFVMDAFHAGLRDNPLYPDDCKEWGYRFAHGVEGRPPRVLSSGYCDDTVIVASSAKAVVQMHAWVREFFGAHCLRLNCDKTVLVCSDGSEVPVLPSVDGEHRATPRGEDHTFRYLGMWVNLRLDWRVQIRRMDRLVRSVCASIRRNGFDLTMSVTTVQQYVLPCLRIGLRVTDVPDRQVRGWDDLVRRAVVDGAGMSMGRSMMVEALYGLLHMPRLVHERWAIRGEELMVARNCDCPSSYTTQARTAAHGRSRRGAGLRRAHRPPPAPTQTGVVDIEHRAPPRGQLYVRSRAAVTEAWLRGQASASFSTGTTPPLVREVKLEGPWVPADACWSSWRPYVCPELRCVGSQIVGGEVLAFPDGSTGEERGQPSGCGVVVTMGGKVLREFGFPCRASGSNYLAEAVALLAAFLAVPAEVDLAIYTDALSVKQAAERGLVMDWLAGALTGVYAITQRSRVLTAARPVLNMIRAVLTAKRLRGGGVRLVHVYSHSGGQGFLASMNDRADRMANAARVRAQGVHLPLRLYGEEAHRMAIGRVPVSGGFRPAILRKLRGRAADAWATRVRGCADSPAPGGAMAPLVGTAAHSARLIAANKRGVLELAAVVAKTHDPGLVKFLVLAVPEWLPVERRLERGGRIAGRGGHCKLCERGPGAARVSETVRHLFTCMCPEMKAALVGLVNTSCEVLRAAGVRVEGPCRTAPHAPYTATHPAPSGRVCWVPVWFDPRRLFWMEVLVREEYNLTEFSRRDPLGAVLGVLPRRLDRLLEWTRGSVGWVRRELRAQGQLRGQLQIALLRGALKVYQTRCRLVDEWWQLPEQAPSRDRLAASVAGRALQRARGREKRRRDNYDRGQCARRDSRLARAGEGTVDSPLAGLGTGAAASVAGLVLTMVPANTAVRVGSNAVFVMSVRNVCSAVCEGVVVSAPLPTGYAFVSADDQRFAGSTGIWSVGALGPGDSCSVRVTALLRPTGSHCYRGQVLRRSGRRRNPIDYLAPFIYSPEDDSMVQYEGALYGARAALPHY